MASATHVRVGVHRQHDDPYVGLRLVHPAGGLHAVHLRHRDVHQDHVGLELVGELDRFETVGRLADDVEALFGHRSAQPFAQHSVIVGQQESDRHDSATPLSGRNLVPGSARAAGPRPSGSA